MKMVFGILGIVGFAVFFFIIWALCTAGKREDELMGIYWDGVDCEEREAEDS